jgi:2-polyprenyl-3-methyl-5-hydroxy-6-metoxy-1,4-benzoquinol methylase
MEKNEYKKMFDSESTYWWYVGRRFIVRNFLKKYVSVSDRPILDVGCGTGVNLSLLQEFSKHVIGLDSSEEALEYCRSRGFSNVRMIHSGEQLANPDSAYLVTMLDVLEHVKDEHDVLKKIHTALADNGYLLVTVPAYQFLWSEHDVALHHFRRYTARRLRSVLKENGFDVIRASYIITFSFPLVLGYRILKGAFNMFSKRTPKTSHVYLPSSLNNLFIKFLETESHIVNHINLPFGTSIIAIAKKEAKTVVNQG